MVHRGAQCHQTGADGRQDAHQIRVSAPLPRGGEPIWGQPRPHPRHLPYLWLGAVAMTEKFCSGTSQIRSAHWINPPWGVFPRLGWSVAPFVRPQQRPRAEPGERRAELLRRALPCLARPPLDPPSQALALARRRRKVIAALRSVSVIKVPRYCSFCPSKAAFILYKGASAKGRSL